MGVTWMEKTVSSPYWTGITLFSIGQRGTDRKTRRHHLMHDAMYSSVRRVAFKGQVFSAPMDWPDLLDQLEKVEKDEERIELPVLGEALLSRVRLSITSGLVDLNKHMKQATVRRDVVVQFIRMHRDSGHPDYTNVFMERVEQRARELAPTNDPTIPSGLLDVLDEDEDEDLDDDVDKAATPAVRIYNEKDLQLEMERTRPQLLLNQRDSDAQKSVEASRSNAFSTISEIKLQTGSNLIDQFHSSYIPRVFNMSLPWCVGGPDFPRQKRWRRCFDDAPEVSLDMYTEMLSDRVEANVRWDWDLNPALWSLSFASKVNLGVSMSIKRCLRRSDESEQANEKKIGEVTLRDRGPEPGLRARGPTPGAQVRGSESKALGPRGWGVGGGEGNISNKLASWWRCAIPVFIPSNKEEPVSQDRPAYSLYVPDGKGGADFAGLPYTF